MYPNEWKGGEDRRHVHLRVPIRPLHRAATVAKELEQVVGHYIAYIASYLEGTNRPPRFRFVCDGGVDVLVLVTEQYAVAIAGPSFTEAHVVPFIYVAVSTVRIPGEVICDDASLRLSRGALDDCVDVCMQ